MPKPSKEDKVLELFFNYSTKPWHFEEIVKKARMSRSNVTKWLKQFAKEGLIKRVKEKGRMPYFVSNTLNPSYFTRKRLYALNLFYNAGLLTHLYGMEAKSVVIFGSYSRGDWHSDSDIDLFIYGDDSDFDKIRFEKMLKKEIQVFTAGKKSDLKQYGEGLLKNIVSGFFVKGRADFL